MYVCIGLVNMAHSSCSTNITFPTTHSSGRDSWCQLFPTAYSHLDATNRAIVVSHWHCDHPWSETIHSLHILWFPSSLLWFPSKESSYMTHSRIFHDFSMRLLSSCICFDEVIPDAAGSSDEIKCPMWSVTLWHTPQTTLLVQPPPAENGKLWSFTWRVNMGKQLVSCYHVLSINWWLSKLHSSHSLHCHRMSQHVNQSQHSWQT